MKSRVNLVVLSEKPLIIGTQWIGESKAVGDLGLFAEILNGLSADILMIPAWSMIARPVADKADRVRGLAELLKAHTNIRLHILCNEPGEADEVKGTGAFTYYINQNAFLDREVFKIIPDSPKRFDAIYNGQLRNFKRHELAVGVESLALIYYGLLQDLPYYEQVRGLLPHAEYLNGPPLGKDSGGQFRFMSQTEVCKHYNTARTGLALSAFEGAMYASAEYLLAGLPVISTRNVGGRDAFADREFWFETEDDAQAVAQAVKHAISQNIPPEYIRAKTIEKMDAHLDRFYDLMDRLVGGPISYRTQFPAVFKDKLWKSVMATDDFIKICAGLRD